MNEKIISLAKKYVNNLLGPLENHYYHSYAHALEVASRASEIAQKKGYPDDIIEAFYLAGLFHDVGFIIQYDDNEYIGAKIATNYLKGIYYPGDKIQFIEDLIIATIYTREPQNEYEQIIKDADMDNLGRDDFFDKGQKLKKEIELIKKIKILDSDWMHHSLELLKEHRFMTNISMKERDPKKQENIQKLENILK